MRWCTVTMLTAIVLIQSTSTTADDQIWQTDDRCYRRRTEVDHEEPKLLVTGRITNTLEDHSLRGLKQNAISSNQNEVSDQIFNMKLQWVEGSCWQEEWIEREWCMQCEGTSCDAGDALYIRRCDDIAQQKFEWIPHRVNDASKGQLKLAYYDLCLEQSTWNSYTLQVCDGMNANQIQVRSSLNDVFELYPMNEQDYMCINQHHDPKSYELIIATTCDLARHSRTNNWEIYWPDRKELNKMIERAIVLRYPDCSSEDPCPRCYGDCDTDDGCMGSLVCYQRAGDDNVPGCTGIGSTGNDYCFEAEPDVLRLRLPFCSQESPCIICQGDCNTDQDCEGDLKCFQRSGNEGVPGCSDIGGIADFDYCYKEPTTAPIGTPTLYPTSAPTITSTTATDPSIIDVMDLPTIANEGEFLSSDKPSIIPSYNPSN